MLFIAGYWYLWLTFIALTWIIRALLLAHFTGKPLWYMRSDLLSKMRVISGISKLSLTTNLILLVMAVIIHLIDYVKR